MTCWLVKPIPTSHSKCLTPLNEWKNMGNAKKLFSATLAAVGHAATAATIEAVSRCHPV